MESTTTVIDYSDKLDTIINGLNSIFNINVQILSWLAFIVTIIVFVFVLYIMFKPFFYYFFH